MRRAAGGGSDKRFFVFLKQGIRGGLYPAFVDALLNRHVTYNEAVDRILEKEQQGEVFVIRPSEPLNIGRMEKDSANVKRVYDIGYSDACRKMEELKGWIACKGDMIYVRL